LHYDIGDEVNLTERWNYFRPRELSADFRVGQLGIIFGRHKEDWADWENTWNQGVFQPRYMEDRLHPQPAGLTGIFFTTKDPHWTVTAGFLPFYLPDFGAHFTTEDGRFVSDNPWFHPPAEKFLYQGEANDIHYSLKRPDYSDVLNNRGGVAKVEFREQGYLSRLSAAYKPTSQMTIGFPSDNRYVIGGDMNIEINARVVYSRTVNWDNIYKNDLWTVSTSVAYDNPVKDRGPEEWTRQEYKPAWIFSGTLARKLGETPLAPQVRVGFLKVDGGDAPDQGRFADTTTKFERRFQFYEAYLLGFDKDFSLGSRLPLRSGLSLIYDRMQNGGVVSWNTGWMFDKNWRADVALNYLGLVSVKQGEIKDGFLTTYRSNDSVSGGVSYVF
jgi:hypothetical protein